MAFVPLGVTTTLARMKANIRSRTGIISPQESEIIELQFDDIVHDAVSFVVGMVRKVDKDFQEMYWTKEASVAAATLNGLSTFDISTLDIYDKAHISVQNATDNRIDIIPGRLFDVFRKYYSTSIFGTITNVGGANGKLVIECNGSPATSDIRYYRNPKKATADADKLDAPEHVMPYIENVAVKNVFGKVKQEVPQEVAAAVADFMSSHRLGIGVKAETST